jgi:hypothetical protein
MSQLKNIACVVAISISTALAGTGCLAQGTDAEMANEQDAPSMQEKTTAGASDRPGEERTGEADQECFGGFGFGLGFPFFFGCSRWGFSRVGSGPWGFGRCLGGCGCL